MDELNFDPFKYVEQLTHDVNGRRIWLSRHAIACPECRSKLVQLLEVKMFPEWKCKNCGHTYQYEPIKENKESMKPIVIAVHGMPGVGKDTLGDYLVKRGDWVKVSFALPIKLGLSNMFNIPMSDIDNPVLKNAPDYKFHRSIRYMMQTLGTEWGRNTIADTVWLQMAEESIKAAFAANKNVVITDLRFDNEAEFIKSIGGYIVHIIRPDNANETAAEKSGVASHASNAGISIPADCTISNDSTMSDFEAKIFGVLLHIKERAKSPK